MDFSNILFRRKCSLTLYKNKKIPLGEMSFFKDFVNDKRGDLYPVLQRMEGTQERILNNRYFVSGNLVRFFCQFFPFATYEISVEDFNDRFGFEFGIKSAMCSVMLGKNHLYFYDSNGETSVPLKEDIKKMVVTCRPGAFDVYFVKNEQPIFFHTFKSEKFENSNAYNEFSVGFAALKVLGKAEIKRVLSYIDCGISQADMRPIRYENGEVMTESGKIYFTASVRQEEQMFQGIFSLVPSTMETELTGAVFFDSGDGKWCGDVASTLVYSRRENKWLIFLCSFNHGHILAHSAFDGDVRFGVNVVDIKLMNKANDDAPFDTTDSFEGDEDPNFIYDEENHRWLLAVCRLDKKQMAYKYAFFESKEPFNNYKYLGCGLDGHETGGSFVKINNEMHFICGNAFDKRADYRVYSKDGMQNLKFDFDDGGFRGWGTLIPVKLGSRTRHLFLTFDRHNGSAYNWSYGNLYLFEADI